MMKNYYLLSSLIQFLRKTPYGKIGQGSLKRIFTRINVPAALSTAAFNFYFALVQNSVSQNYEFQNFNVYKNLYLKGKFFAKKVLRTLRMGSFTKINLRKKKN